MHDQTTFSNDKVSATGVKEASDSIPKLSSIRAFLSPQEDSFEPQVSGCHVTESSIHNKIIATDQEKVKFQNVKQTQSAESGVISVNLEGQASDIPNVSDMPSIISEEGRSDPLPRSCQVQVISRSQEITFEQQICHETDSSIPSTTSSQTARDKVIKSKYLGPHTKANDSKEHFLIESDIKELMDITWKAREKWFNIGIQLEMSVSDLKVISQNKSGQPDGCFVEMLVQWLRQGKATWEALINALKSEPVGYLQLANEIRDSKTPDPLAGLRDDSRIAKDKKVRSNTTSATWALGGVGVEADNLEERVKTQQAEIKKQLSALSETQKQVGAKLLQVHQHTMLQQDLQKLEQLQTQLKSDPTDQTLLMQLLGQQTLLIEHLKEIIEELDAGKKESKSDKDSKEEKTEEEKQLKVQQQLQQQQLHQLASADHQRQLLIEQHRQLEAEKQRQMLLAAEQQRQLQMAQLSSLQSPASHRNPYGLTALSPHAYSPYTGYYL